MSVFCPFSTLVPKCNGKKLCFGIFRDLEGYCLLEFVPLLDEIHITIISVLTESC